MSQLTDLIKSIVRREVPGSGWRKHGKIWTYVSGTSFTTNGDTTGLFTKGRTLRCKQGGGYLYYWVTSSSHAGGTTTVNVSGVTALSDAAITDNYFEPGVPRVVSWRSYTATTQGLGANPDVFVSGFYRSSPTDANLNQGALIQNFGSANASYAAHAFIVAGGAGTVDTGVVGLKVVGKSITDKGVQTVGDEEVLSADITTLSTDDYLETTKKWTGTVVYTLYTVSGAPTTYSLDFNYGIAKYDDWGNQDFVVSDIDAVGLAGANDDDFDIRLLLHTQTGWTYHATAFSPINLGNTIASLAGDHVAADRLYATQHFAWKRDNLTQAIQGTGLEGFIILIESSANNAVEFVNINVGALI
jgi:hypothetical protein